MTIVSSFLTFPNINWWVRAITADILILDSGENFQKMSYRNRYRISGSNNPILLTVPLEKGRDQHTSAKELKIFNEEKWQVQHWRTLVSVYKRSPYFDHYERELQPLFEKRFTWLTDFNLSGIEWIAKQLNTGFQIQTTDVYVKEYAADVTDLRNEKRADQDAPHYHQVFEDRVGFIPNLSVLDLLFSEGPISMHKLKG